MDGGVGAVASFVSGNDDDAVYNRVGETSDDAGGGVGAVSGAGLGGPGSGGGGVSADGGTAVISGRNGCPSDNDLAIAGGEHDVARGGGDRARDGGFGGGGGAGAFAVIGNDDDAVFNRVGETPDGAGGGVGAVSGAGSVGLARGSGGGGGGVSADGGTAIVSDRNGCPSDNDLLIAGGEHDAARGGGRREGLERDGDLGGGFGAVACAVSGKDEDAVYSRVGETHDGAGGGGGAGSFAGSGGLARDTGGGGVSADGGAAVVNGRNECPSDNDLPIAGGEPDVARGGGRIDEGREDLEDNSCPISVTNVKGTSGCQAISGMHATTG